MNNNNITDYLKYWIEYLFSKSLILRLLILGLFTFFIITCFSIIVYIYQGNIESASTFSFLDSIWYAFVRILDPGVLAGTVLDTGRWQIMFIAIIITLIGLVIVSTFIGFIVTAVGQQFEEYKKGRSKVLENNHIIVLGWTPKIYKIIDQFSIGHAVNSKMRKKLCVVILAEKEKTEMEDLMRDNCNANNNLKIVCRSGSPILIDKLKNLSLTKSKSVVVLAPEVFDPDSRIIKTLLACSKIISETNDINISHILIEVTYYNNLHLMREAFYAKENKVNFIPVLTNKFISELICQTSLQPGLSKVYEELLSFNSSENEIYVVPINKFNNVNLIGTDFKDCLNLFPQSSLIGVIRDADVIVNPLVYNSTLYSNNNKQFNMYIEENDKLIVIAKTLLDIKPLNETIKNLSSALYSEKNISKPVKNTLIVGWNRKMLNIILELVSYISSQSTLTICANINMSKKVLLDLLEKELLHHDRTMDLSYNKDKDLLVVGGIKVEFILFNEDILNRSIINELLKINDLKILILLNYSGLIKDSKKGYILASDMVRKETADAKTVKSLLELNSYFNKNPQYKNKLSIISELELSHNKDIVKDLLDMDDFIISDDLISLYIAQVNFNPYGSQIYSETLFSEDGSEMYLKSASCYFELDKKIFFSEVVNHACKKHEIAIGYQLNNEKHIQKELLSKIILNPNKDVEVMFHEGDKVLVLAEEFEIIN